MIRSFKVDDLEAVMQIWLHTNVQTHSYVPKEYWMNNYDMVKKFIPESEVFVDEEEGEITGFIGLEKGYIAGLFVKKDYQSKGIGHRLVDYVKGSNDQLSLSVYTKNESAISFYKRQDFEIKEKQVDENTGEEEYVMQWMRK